MKRRRESGRGEEEDGEWNGGRGGKRNRNHKRKGKCNRTSINGITMKRKGEREK